MTDRHLRIVLSTSSTDAMPLVEAAEEFSALDPSTIRVHEDTGTVSMWMAGFKVVIVNGLRTNPPYEDQPRERIVRDVVEIVRELARDLKAANDQDRRRRRAELDHAMMVRMLHDRTAFAGDDCADADLMTMHARTTWGHRRVRMSRPADRTTGVSGAMTRTTTLDEWPDEPIVCEVAFDPPVERGMITISAYRAEIRRPWDIDAVSTMRMIARPVDDDIEGEAA